MMGLALATSSVVHAQDLRTPQGGDLSLKLEIQPRIEDGVEFLLRQQNEDGSIGDARYPALTGLALSAIMGNPERDPDAALPEGVVKAYDFLLSKQKEDGGVYDDGLATYNTSLSLSAFLFRGDEPEFESAIRAARGFLIGQQADYDVKGELDNEFDGGIGYGGSYTHSDLSNTHFAMEALHYSKKLLADKPQSAGEELDWDAAVQFVSRCQNLETNDLTKGDMVVREEDKGGFMYFPGDSKAGDVEMPGEKVAFRSYGSMTYAGVLSFIYAEMNKSDERIVAAMDWLSENYTLEENPGMGAQGLFYYYHTMAKALTLAEVGEKLTLADGSSVNWREKLAVKLFDQQKQDGSWINEGSSRWKEDNPVLVTAYSLLALEYLSRAL